ncbi:MAG TPA: SDR family NAD(P)-dependent oxidoreductase [Ilumatobacter sp.]|nr:SDR family NAD(P)-dependent oxidoreductase [Ilumatobacter sp.]
MENALQEAQTIVLFGGTSDIGRAMVAELLTPSARTLVLACRRPGEARPDEFAQDGLDVVAIAFDAADTTAHEGVVKQLVEQYGDLDVAVIAFGQLGEQADYDADPAAAAALVNVNMGGAVSTATAVAQQMKTQGHGHLGIVGSVAGDRTRPANYTYGATKAGLDAFGQGLADAMLAHGVTVTMIRPGFVHSKMTEGRKAQPFATTPDVVGRQAVAGMRSGKHTVYTPGLLRYVFTTLRHLPRWVWRRMPFD